MLDGIKKELTKDLKKEVFTENTILSGFRGSVAHGTYAANSIDDIDLMGVYLFPREIYLGLKQPKETVEKFIGKWDTVSYEFKKFVRLLLKFNPNVMALLFLKEEHYIDKLPYGIELINNRELFVSKKAYYSYTGYAHAQLKKMENCKCLGYMGKKRKELVEKFNFDCKNASHCIRLLTMGIEFLKEGNLNVFREKDADLFLQIKSGEWSLESVKSYAKDLFEKAEIAYEKSPLPRNPDYDKVNKMVKTIMLDYINKGAI